MTKVVVSVFEGNLDSKVYPTFGRCPGFLLADITEGKVTSFFFYDNTSNKTSKRLGSSTAEFAIDAHADAIITGSLGPSALSILSSAGLGVYRFSGNVRRSLSDFSKGKLDKITASVGRTDTSEHRARKIEW